MLKDEAIAARLAPLPSRRIQWLMSLLVIVHFFAIGTAVTSYSAPQFPAPQLAVAATEPLQPYLQATFLNNAYRFFAPNPGTPTVMWFRIQYADRSIRWQEFPGPEHSAWFRAAYQRELNLSLLLSQQLAPDPAHGNKPRFTQLGLTCLASVTRHIAFEQPQPVKAVGVYCMQHAGVTPQQVRDGWETSDLRTYQAMFVGAFNPAGERIDELRPDVLMQTSSDMVAGVLQADVYPLLRKTQGDPLLVIRTLNLPTPVAQFLTRHPQLLNPALPAGDIKPLIEKLAASTKPGQA